MRPGLGHEGDLPVVDGAGLLLPEPERLRRLRLAIGERDGGPGADLGAARRLASAWVSAAPLYVGNQVDVLVDGNATYDAMASAIDGADDAVQLEIYILANDAVGWRLAERLVLCARRGVRVQLVLDGFGSRSAMHVLMPRLIAAGVSVRVFHPLSWATFTAPTRLWHRDHRKLLIVDGRIAFTGGINFSESYASRRRSRLSPRRAVARGWRDTHIRVQGPGVAAFAVVFTQRWRELNAPALLASSRVDASLAPQSSVPIARFGNREHGNDLVSALTSTGGDAAPSQIVHAITSATALARRRVWLSQAYFAPPPAVVDALCARAQAGVDVRLLLPSRSDFYPVQFAARSHYARLLRAGVRVFEYQPAVLHTKTVLVDSLWSSVGSCNLDWRSLYFNDELNAVVLSVAMADALKRVFERDLADAREIRIDAWSRRGPHRRLAEAAARLFRVLW